MPIVLSGAAASAQRWLVLMAALAVTVCCLVGGINFVVDPWGLNEAVSIAGFNARKPDPIGVARLHKAYSALRIRPSAVAMGSSSAEHGINMQHPSWAGFGAVYNLSFPGATIAEISAYLREVHRISPLARAMIGLDLFSFNAHREPSEQTAQALGAMRNPLQRIGPYFTRSMLAGTRNTLLQQERLVDYFLPTGQSSAAAYEQWLSRFRGHHNFFVYSSRDTVRDLLPAPAHRYELQRGAGTSTLDQFREMLDFARKEGIELQLFISPCHAWELETIRAMGLWPNLEYLKQQLAFIVDRYAGAPRIVLWDFADYHAITNENVPQVDDGKTRMRWFWDARHYTAALGDMVQDRMSGAVAPSAEALGVKLDAKNVNAWLLHVREHQQQYREAHPGDVSQIEALVAPALKSLRGR